MKEEEDIATYFLMVDEMVNSIQGIGETIEEDSILQNILRTLPSRFNSKVPVLEDRSNLDNLEKDDLYGIVTIYEMRIEQENVSTKEVSFKSSRKQ